MFVSHPCRVKMISHASELRCILVKTSQRAVKVGQTPKISSQLHWTVSPCMSPGFCILKAKHVWQDMFLMKSVTTKSGTEIGHVTKTCRLSHEHSKLFTVNNRTVSPLQSLNQATSSGGTGSWSPPPPTLVHTSWSSVCFSVPPLSYCGRRIHSVWTSSAPSLSVRASPVGN